MPNHRLVNHFTQFSAVSFLLFSAALPLAAQEVSAGLTGRVSDPSGASVGNASVTAKDLDRGTEWPTKTQADGIFSLPRIPVGRYSLKVEAPGFKSYINREFVLELNQRGRVDVALQIGAITDSVTVDASGPLLQTDTTQVGSVIDSKTINNTPLVSRNPIALTLLAPGVTTPDPASFNNGVRGGGGGRPYVNGNREQSNNFLLDGVDNNQVSDNLSAYQPNLDAIEEFKLITSNASAEFGNFQGGIVNVLIKSGTNQYHGNLFEDFRNDKLNANNWGRNWQGLARPPLRWNQYGGTFGGPIFKDKLFFFGDYQALRQAVPTSLVNTTVMPLAWRQGDFSALLDTKQTGKAAGIQLYNPFSIVDGLRQPFAGNIIPASLLSSPAVKLLNDTSLYPAPQTANFTTPNYQYSNSSRINTDQGDVKVDYRPNSKDYISGRYSQGRQDQPGVNSFPLFYNSFNQSPFKNGVLNWTRTINPTFVNEARIGVNYIKYFNGGADKGLGDIAAKVGILSAGAGLLSLGSGVNGGPGFSYASGLGSANIGTSQLFANTTYHFADNLTIIRGRHMVKTGFNVLRQDLNTFYSGNGGRSGYLNFGGRFTAANPASPTGTLIGEADFLLGLPTDIGRGLSTGTWGHRGTILGFYGQDDWRVTNNLTLNLGLRWEYHTPWVEVKDRQSNFDLITGQLLLPQGQTCPIANCANVSNRALYNSFKKDFQPRVGFAYTPDVLQRKLVVRGAYTISSFLEGTGTNLRLTLNPPYATEYAALYNTAAFALPGSTLTQGLSALNPNDPFKGATLRLWDPGVRPAVVQQWNFSTDFQLPGQNVLTTGYVGQHGTHLMVATPYKQNQLIPGIVNPGPGIVVPGPYLSGNPTLKSAIAQISGTASNGNQKYNSLQATLKKRFSSGAQYQVAYTFSHGLSDSIGYYGAGGQSGGQSAYVQNLYDRHSEWASSFFDVKHSLVVSGVYEIPVGKSKKYGSNMNRVADGVVGGWQLGGIISAHTGFPLTIKANTDPSGTGARSFRASTNGTAPNDPHNVGPGALYLDPSPYYVPPTGTFGNTSPAIVRGPGMSRTDVSLSKKFYISERKYFELRGEAFNAGNHPIFTSPASQNVQSPLFGQIRSSQAERTTQIVGKFYF